MDRLTAAKQLLGSFLNRTEGFQYHHAVGLVSCSDKPKIEVPLTDDFEMFEVIVNNLMQSVFYSQRSMFPIVIKSLSIIV